MALVLMSNCLAIRPKCGGNQVYETDLAFRACMSLGTLLFSFILVVR